MEALSVEKRVGYPPEAYDNSPNPYHDDGLSYECWDGAPVHRRSSHTDFRKRSEFIFDTGKQPKPDHPFETDEPVKRTRGTNNYGNRYRGENYPDNTNPYEYDNLNGTCYKKDRDGGAGLYGDDGRLLKRYPAPTLEQLAGDNQYGTGGTRDPPGSRKALVNKRDYTQRREFFNPRNRFEGDRKLHRQLQPTVGWQNPPFAYPSSSPASETTSDGGEITREGRKQKAILKILQTQG
jgi:hypothetical protein